MSLTPQFGSIVPSQSQVTLNSNYLQFNDGAGNDFAQQYLPEIYEAEVERYGNRTLSGFLRMVGAEMPMTSDQVIWSEQNRLHISYDGCVVDGAGTGFTIPVNGTTIQNVISVNDTIVILDPATGVEAKGVVTVSGATAVPATGAITVRLYNDNTPAVQFGAAQPGLKIFVYGSDYQKGSSIATGDRVSVQPQFTQYSNSPIIIRNQYTVNGSDMAQIGWVEVATEDGTSGYLWYLKAESETRRRFEDYLEMAMVEGEYNQNAATLGTNPGTQGLFAAIQTRGNVEVGFTASNGLDEFDAILKNLDTQGAIEENMLFLNRQTALDFDDMLAAISAGSQGGTAYGLFENSEEMALNLGFSGFRRGSYDFYKTDWKYLNDASTRGAIDGISSIEGVLVPAGTSTVYDQILGTNIRRPFLHVRYRASQADDRRMKSWLTGSAGGAFTSTLDAMEVNFLSERCLVTQAANNFVLFKGI
jgi:arginine repressor